MSLAALVRFWREGIIGGLLIVLAVTLISKAGVERKNTRLKTVLGQLSDQIDRERELVRTRTAAAKAQDAAHAARVERDQVTVSMEVTHDYQKDLAALRARYDALRLHSGKTAAADGGSRDKGVSEVPEAAGRVDGAASEVGLPAEDALIASEQALQLKALQAWVEAQEGVDR